MLELQGDQKLKYTVCRTLCLEAQGVTVSTFKHILEERSRVERQTSRCLNINLKRGSPPPTTTARGGDWVLLGSRKGKQTCKLGAGRPCKTSKQKPLHYLSLKASRGGHGVSVTLRLTHPSHLRSPCPLFPCNLYLSQKPCDFHSYFFFTFVLLK